MAEHTMKTRDDWSVRWARWQRLARRARAIAERLERDRSEQAWVLAATVGIPRNMCCLHNASIDEDLKGWCAGPGGLERLRVAKRVKWMLDEWAWEPVRKADAIVRRGMPAA